MSRYKQKDKEHNNTIYYGCIDNNVCTLLVNESMCLNLIGKPMILPSLDAATISSILSLQIIIIWIIHVEFKYNS